MDNYLFGTMAASGNEPEETTHIELSVAATAQPQDLEHIRDYFLDRCAELQNDCRNGTPWVFICAAVLLEYLANLVIEPNRDDSSPKNDLVRYTEFITNWLCLVREKYVTFEFDSESDGESGKTKQDLPLQMYCVLRSAMVHSFSMIPTTALWTAERLASATSPTKFGRRGSIVIAHASSGYAHLSNHPKQDSACFIAEDFVKDIRSVVLLIYEHAQQNEELKNRIVGAYNRRPPVGVI